MIVETSSITPSAGMAASQSQAMPAGWRIHRSKGRESNRAMTSPWRNQTAASPAASETAPTPITLARDSHPASPSPSTAKPDTPMPSATTVTAHRPASICPRAVRRVHRPSRA